MDYTVTQIFAPVVFKSKIETNYDSVFEELKLKTQFIQNSNAQCYASADFHILDTYLDLKEEIKKCFNFFKNTILKYESTEFQITTSWMTKVRPGCMSHFHNHKNCMYSGVLYFDTFDHCAPIEFTNTNLYQDCFLLNQPSEKNIYNNDVWSIIPEKNNIIFFPSYLMHRVGIHECDSSRYSLAFNFIPDGIFGSADSTLRVEIF